MNRSEKQRRTNAPTWFRSAEMTAGSYTGDFTGDPEQKMVAIGSSERALGLEVLVFRQLELVVVVRRNGVLSCC